MHFYFLVLYKLWVMMMNGQSGSCDKWQKETQASLQQMKEVTIRDIFGGGEGHEFFEKSMKTPSMYWGITIFSNFDVRVGEKRQFLSDSKKHEF